MDTEVIERGIEENADLWRDKEMRSAFMNTYNPILGLSSIYVDMEHPSDEHQNAWLKMRLYQYYQDHKDSVDKYGKITSEMQLSQEEVENLQLYLSKLHDERMAYISNLKEREKHEPQKTLNLFN